MFKTSTVIELLEVNSSRVKRVINSFWRVVKRAQELFKSSRAKDLLNSCSRVVKELLKSLRVVKKFKGLKIVIVQEFKRC